MRYPSALNAELKKQLHTEDPFILFGQNVSAGSCLSGLTRGLGGQGGLKMVNTPNCENAMVGFGFGMMLRGVDSAFFVKQHDFLLLTLDHMVNTYNMLRMEDMKAGFTIVCIVVDSGFEGPQSRLNNLSEFCSIADIPTYTISSQIEAEAHLAKLKEPGFRILALSQRLFREEIIDAPGEKAGDGMTRFGKGEQLTIAAFNFSLPQALSLQETAKSTGIEAEVISVSHALPRDWEPVIESAHQSKRVVVLDDSRSINRSSDRLRLALYENVEDCRILALQREGGVKHIPPNADRFEVDEEAVLLALFGPRKTTAAGASPCCK
jgi:pyruvate/2-oxoglutarate/acetoin dehydrogenase E1 component